MRTQILLPLTANERLTGIVSLGPKLSEAPYTETDIRLLQAIVSQMGLAVENSRLVTSLASEAAAREIASRELEIAREVQERLFPRRTLRFPVSTARATAVRRAGWAANTTISCCWTMAGSGLPLEMCRARASRRLC